MLKNVLSFHRIRVEDAMVPRADIVAVAADTNLGELLSLFRTAGHSRLPVYSENLDDIIGIVHIKDVLPSIFDPYPNVLREAMGHGLPCIGSDSGGIPEIVGEGETGRLFPVGEPEPLAQALIDVLGDPADAERMGRAAHATVTSSQTWDHVAERMAPYIERAAAER